MLINSAPIPILVRDKGLSKGSSKLLYKESNLGPYYSSMIRVAKKVPILSETESPVIIVTPRN